MKRKCTTHHHFPHPEMKKEYEAQLILQEFSQNEDRIQPNRRNTDLSLQRDGDNADNITTWNHPISSDIEKHQDHYCVKKSKVKHHTFYRNRINFQDISSRVDTHHKTLCKQRQLQTQLLNKNTRKCIKNEIISQRPKCAISMLSPQFKQQQVCNPKTKTKTSFYFSGSLLNRIYLSKQKQPFHEKRGLIIKKIKNDIINGFGSRTENNSAYSTIIEQNPRVASMPSEQNKYEKTYSSVHFNLCLVTEGNEQKTKEEWLPKAPRHTSMKTNRVTKSKKLFNSKRIEPRQQISSELLKSAHQFKMLHSLLTRQKLQ